jgi:hypothetical protein
MSPSEAATAALPKLPELDKEDLKAVRSFLPGKLLSRTAALLSLVLLVLGFAAAVDAGLRRLLGVAVDLPAWAYYGLLLGAPFAVVVVQVVNEWLAERNRRKLIGLAVKAGTDQTGYFRIAPYQDTEADRAAFRRPDHADDRVLAWIERAAAAPLYLTGDSGSGKSSLLNASVLPRLRAQGWRVVEARAWQDPQAALRDALLKARGPRRTRTGEPESLRELLEDAARRAPARLLVVLDQFEEFVILATPDLHRQFADFCADLRARPIAGLTLLLVLRSDYQPLLEEIGLPVPRAGENLFQVARFRFSAATSFMEQSGLGLPPASLDRLLSSAAEIDDTPGLVRPITLNVIGYVLASGRAVAPSLDAGLLVRRYIEQTVNQPAIRDCAPRILEQMVTEQGTKQPRAEQQLSDATNLKPAEVRGVLNGLRDAALARPLDAAQGVWELSHDFVARAVVPYLSRRRGRALRRAGAFAAPALLAITVLAGGGVGLWEHFAPYRLRAELADLGINVRTSTEGIVIETTGRVSEENLVKSGPTLRQICPCISVDLSSNEISSLAPINDMTVLQALDVSNTKVADLAPLKGMTALQTLDVSGTQVADLAPLKGMTALQTLIVSGTQVADLAPLEGMTALRNIDISGTTIDLAAAKALLPEVNITKRE